MGVPEQGCRDGGLVASVPVVWDLDIYWLFMHFMGLFVTTSDAGSLLWCAGGWQLSRTLHHKM